MNPEEARIELDACTLRPQDASVEARDLASLHPEISQWLDQRRGRDEIISCAMLETTVPAGLRERLLQIEAQPQTAPHRRLVLMAALAGMAMVAIALLSVFPAPSDEMPAWQKDSMAMVLKADSGDMLFDQESGDLNVLKASLASSASPVPQNLPKGLAPKQLMGCKTFDCGDRKASLVCFVIAPGKEAHLVTLNNAGLADMPPQHQPQFKAHGEWNVAMWSDGAQSYLLFTKSPKDKLKSLFASVSVPRQIPFTS